MNRPAVETSLRWTLTLLVAVLAAAPALAAPVAPSFVAMAAAAERPVLGGDDLEVRTSDPRPTRSVLPAVEAASPEPRGALAGFVREAGGERITEAVAMAPRAIEISVHDGAATSAAGSIADVRTRALGRHGRCGNQR